VLRERERARQGRAPQPTAAAIDSQSVKTTSVGGVRGYDGAKKLNGRKRRPLVDTPGLVLTATVHAADIQDRAAVPQVLASTPRDFPRLAKLWADQGYTGAGKAWIAAELGWTVEFVRQASHARGEWRPIGDLNDLRTLRFAGVRLPKAPKQFHGILPRRWVGERTFSRLVQSRRLAQEYGHLCATSEAYIYAAMSRSCCVV
jgi:transposase